MSTLDGRFRAKVIEAHEGKSKNGHVQVAMRFEITRGPKQGQELSHWLYLNTQANALRSLEAMRRCGYDGKSFASMLRGAEVELVVEAEQRQDGKGTRSRVRWVNEARALSSGGELHSDEVAKLHDKLRKLAETKGLKFELPPTGVEDDPDPEYDERADDVPF